MTDDTIVEAMPTAQDCLIVIVSGAWSEVAGSQRKHVERSRAERAGRGDSLGDRRRLGAGRDRDARRAGYFSDPSDLR